MSQPGCNCYSNIQIGGTLIAGDASSTERVVFTSIHEDIEGDDDGADIAPRPGDWRMVSVSSGGVAQFFHVDMRYGGHATAPGIYFNPNNVRMLHNFSGEVELDDVDFSLSYFNAPYRQYHQGTSMIKNSRFHDASVGVEIGLEGASKISGTSFSSTSIGIAVFGGSVQVSSSTFIANDYGVRVSSGFATITNSSFVGNRSYGVINEDQHVISAVANWWGTSTGPTHASNPLGSGDWISDRVEYHPVLQSEPERDVRQCSDLCYSNVLFLPGLQASRLYRIDDDGETDRLWEPTSNADVRDLYLDAEGESIYGDVYTKDIIDEAYGFGPDVYKSFINMMNDLRESGKINDWAPLPYDWRHGIEDLLGRGRQYADGRIVFGATLGSTTTPIIFQEVERLARTSKSGKVTIIAHSNGGLLAKALMARLYEQDKSKLVDRVILLASPQIGTPKAVASLLHGEGQELAGGWILNKETARALGRHMPGGYQLVPSKEYFRTVIDPVVLIRNKPATSELFSAYGSSIETYDELIMFLLGSEGRTPPLQKDTESPEVLLKNLLLESENLHQLIDGWSTSPDVEFIQVGGYGLDTIKGIRYMERWDGECDCSRIAPVPLFTDDGDGTVVLPSALAATSGKRYWVEINQSNRNYEQNWDHASFTEILPVQEFIKNIIENNTDVVPRFLSETSPVRSSGYKKLRFTLHSPLSISFTDSQGRVVGRAATPSFPTELTQIQEDVPNSFYMEFGELKIVGVPESEGIIAMVGERLGVFTLDIERFVDDALVGTTTFADIPVATGTIIVFPYDPSTTTPPHLLFDLDGNGVVDITLTESGFSEHDGVELLRHLITGLMLSEKERRQIDHIFARLSRELSKEDVTHYELKFERLLERFEGALLRLRQKGTLSDSEFQSATLIIGIIRQEIIQ